MEFASVTASFCLCIYVLFKDVKLSDFVIRLNPNDETFDL